MSWVIWFSRHDMTDSQRAEITERHGPVALVFHMKDAASSEINTEEELEDTLARVIECVQELKAAAVYGVFPVPVQHKLYADPDRKVPCYAAWNIRRTVEGGKPTFEHKQFMLVGVI